MTIQTTLGPARDAARTAHLGSTRHARSGAWLRVVMDLPRRWRERTRARRQERNLCELDDHMLQDIGLTRSAFGCRQRSDSGARVSSGRHEEVKMTVLERLDTSISELPSSSPLVYPSDNQDNTVALRLRAAGSSFFWAMQLLPYQRREAMYALYAFCR